MNEQVEQMAREYKQAITVAGDDNAAIEQMILLEENQLDMLGDLSSLRSPLTVRTIGYLKNLIFRSLKELNALIGNASYIPSIRTSTCSFSAPRAIMSMYDQQLSILILSDKLSSLPPSFVAYENRKLSLIVALLR